MLHVARDSSTRSTCQFFGERINQILITPVCTSSFAEARWIHGHPTSFNQYTRYKWLTKNHVDILQTWGMNFVYINEREAYLKSSSLELFDLANLDGTNGFYHSLMDNNIFKLILNHQEVLSLRWMSDAFGKDYAYVLQVNSPSPSSHPSIPSIIQTPILEFSENQLFAVSQHAIVCEISTLTSIPMVLKNIIETHFKICVEPTGRLKNLTRLCSIVYLGLNPDTKPGIKTTLSHFIDEWCDISKTSSTLTHIWINRHVNCRTTCVVKNDMDIYPCPLKWIEFEDPKADESNLVYFPPCVSTLIQPRELSTPPPPSPIPSTSAASYPTFSYNDFDFDFCSFEIIFPQSSFEVNFNERNSTSNSISSSTPSTSSNSINPNPSSRLVNASNSTIPTSNPPTSNPTPFRCAICWNNIWEIIFSCGHGTCRNCSENLKTTLEDVCHICRRQIHLRLPIFT